MAIIEIKSYDIGDSKTPMTDAVSYYKSLGYEGQTLIMMALSHFHTYSEDHPINQKIADHVKESRP